MKQVFVAAVVTSLLLTADLWAQINSNLSITGFSEGGRYLAFAVSGYNTATGCAFSLIQVVGVVKNKFVANDF